MALGCIVAIHLTYLAQLPGTQFWHAQLQPDMVANQLKDEAVHAKTVPGELC